MMFRRIASSVAAVTNRTIAASKTQKRKLSLHGFQNYHDGKKRLRGERIQAYAAGVFMFVVAPIMFLFGEHGHYAIHYVWDENNRPVHMDPQPGTKRFVWFCGHCTWFDPICKQKCRELEKEKKEAYMKLTGKRV